MPGTILCLEEGVFLSERRHEAVWLAVTELACELHRERARVLRGWGRPHIAGREEESAWLEAFFRMKNYRPEGVGVDLSRYYTPTGYDTQRIARELRIKPKDAAVLVRKAEKALMLAAAEEVLGAIRHSREYGHRVKLTKD